jgi:integrase
VTQYQVISAKAPYSDVLATCQSEKTKQAYANDYVILDRYLAGGDPWKMTKKQMFDLFMELRKKGHTDRSLTRYKAAYSRLFSLGVEMEQITFDPTTILKKNFPMEPAKRNPKALSKEQREHLKASLKWDTPFHERVSLSVMIGLWTGLRKTEIRLLKWENINFATKKLHVIGKRNKEANLPIVAPLLELLKKYRQDSGHVIGEITDDPFHDWHKVIVKRWCGWGDDVVYTCHVLRHSFGTELAEAGVPIETIRILMRHASIEMTSKYLTTTQEAITKAAEDVFKS